MGVRESLLNTITSVADSDFVRIVTSAGASSKATVRNLFKGFESNLSAKSDLTVSDYVRVVGSDNEAYKQSVSDLFNKILKTYTSGNIAGKTQTIKSALDASVAIPNPANGRLAYHNDTDFDVITEEWCLAKGAHSPVAASFFYLHTIAYMANDDGTVNIGKQIAFSYSTTDEEVYVRRRAGGAWTAWQKTPTRAEVDALTVKTAAVTGGSLPLYVSRMGDAIFLRALYINPSSAITAGVWSTLGVLPTGYRPSATAYIGGVFTDASGRPYGFRGAIATNGTISGCFEDSISTSVSLFGTVPVILQ